jgi:hypothetical protein
MSTKELRMRIMMTLRDFAIDTLRYLIPERNETRWKLTRRMKTELPALVLRGAG